ncbi:MFS transporter [Chloroflexota bacterium]
MKKNPYIYGYVIVAACFCIQAIGIGTFVAFGVFFKPILAEFGWSRATLASAQSVAIVAGGFLGILMGRLNDRFGPRLVTTIAGFFFGVGLLLMSGVNSVWQLYLFYGVLVGIGMSAIDVIPLTTVARWFTKQRGMMTGIVKMGTGTGQLIIPFAASLLIVNWDWRNSYLILGAAVMVLLMAIGQLLRRDPASTGLSPSGSRGHSEAGERDTEAGFNLQEAMRTRQLWTICFAIFSAIFCLLIIMTHIVPHATDLGIAPTIAAGILSTIGGGEYRRTVYHRYFYRSYRQ